MGKVEKEKIGIEGTLLMLDDSTPHVAVVVQAVSDEKVMATTLSDESGKYRFATLKRREYKIRCYTLNGYVYYGEGKARGRGSGAAGSEEMVIY